MNPNDILQKLQSLATSDDFIGEADELTKEWSTQPDSYQAVDPILLFLEEHPDLDVGSPGPLVHFVEQFSGEKYEAKLLKSVHRKPTTHTLWMLNRVINGIQDPDERRKYIAAMAEAKDHPLADPEAREEAEHFLEILEGDGEE